MLSIQETYRCLLLRIPIRRIGVRDAKGMSIHKAPIREGFAAAALTAADDSAMTSICHSPSCC